MKPSVTVCLLLVAICEPGLASEAGVALPKSTSGGAVNIHLGFYLDDVSSIDIRNMDFRVDYYLTEYWEVPNKTCAHYLKRLRSANVNTTKDSQGSVFISPGNVNMLWWPDTYISNAKLIDMPSAVAKFSKMKIKATNTKCVMTHTSKLLAKISCQMQLRNYPRDRQRCLVWFLSYPSELVTYSWSAHDPIKKNPLLRLSRYTLIGLTPGMENTSLMTDKYSSLYVAFDFEREMAHNIIHTFAPSLLLVTLSWFSLWMGLDAVPGRITLSVTSLLALVTQFSSMRKELPPVAYINGSDLWMVVCMTFVFSSLSEFSVVKFMDHQFKKKQKKLQQESAAHFLTSLSLEKKPLSRQAINDLARDHQARINTIEKMARILFPVAFGIWNAIYWPMLILRKF